MRASEFRALVELPGVGSAGKAAHGLGRKGVTPEFTRTPPQSGGTDIRLIAPKTSRVLAEQVTADARTNGEAKATVHRLDARWTNDAPAVPNC